MATNEALQRLDDATTGAQLTSQHQPSERSTFTPPASDEQSRKAARAQRAVDVARLDEAKLDMSVRVEASRRVVSAERREVYKQLAREDMSRRLDLLTLGESLTADAAQQKRNRESLRAQGASPERLTEAFNAEKALLAHQVEDVTSRFRSALEKRPKKMSSQRKDWVDEQRVVLAAGPRVSGRRPPPAYTGGGCDPTTRQ